MPVWEDPLGVVRVAYNAPAYLRSRHGIEGADAQLTTVANALAALESAAPVNVPIVVEHDTNAGRVGLDLDPTKLVVFGNPSLGTGLMRTDQSVALDVPQKILVTRTGADPTVITWNDPHWVARRHGVTGQRELLDTLSGALADFASVGAGP